MVIFSFSVTTDTPTSNKIPFELRQWNRISVCDCIQDAWPVAGFSYCHWPKMEPIPNPFSWLKTFCSSCFWPISSRYTYTYLMITSFSCSKCTCSKQKSVKHVWDRQLCCVEVGTQFYTGNSAIGRSILWQEPPQSIINLKHEGQSFQKISRILKVSSSAVTETI